MNYLRMVREWLCPLISIFAGTDAVAHRYGTATADYETIVSRWTSCEDVADWFRANFVFYCDRNYPGRKLQSPAETFKRKKGACYDAARFAVETLNKVNPEYGASAVFVKNKAGSFHHWAAAFTRNGRLYIMDYGASTKWVSMIGVHGPYDSLRAYEAFLSSLNIEGFAVDSVEYRILIEPGIHQAAQNRSRIFG
jgi:hypothetical protein